MFPESLKRKEYPALIACIGPDHTYDEKELANLEKLKPEQIHFFAPSDRKDELGMKHNGHFTYVISPITERNKESGLYQVCTGLVVSGLDKKTGRPISFLTHQNSAFLFKNDTWSRFQEDLNTTLKEFVARVRPGTSSAAFYAGSIQHPVDDLNGAYRQEYMDTVEFCRNAVATTLGTELEVFEETGIDYDVHAVRAVRDIEHNRLYILRSEQDHARARWKDTTR